MGSQKRFLDVNEPWSTGTSASRYKRIPGDYSTTCWMKEDHVGTGSSGCCIRNLKSHTSTDK